MMFNEFLKSIYGTNEPIFVEDVQYKGYSKAWIFKELKKLLDNGELKRFCTGVYYFPIKTALGDSLLSSRKIINRRFISDGVEIYGYISGFSLLNMAGLSTQVPNMVEISTNKESTRVRDVYIGSQRVRLRRSRTTINKKNAATLQFLELMNAITPAGIDDTGRFMLSRFILSSEVSKKSVTDYAGYFPARAIKNMVESGAVYELT